MKKITIISAIILIFCSYVTKATVRTVSNSPITAGQYTVIDSAINHSAVGDTVYVNGSAFDYGNVSINRRITLIGAGYALTGTAYNLPTTVDNISIDSTAFSIYPVNGSQIIGFYCNSAIGASIITTNITVGRCATNGLNTNGGQGWIIENCIITGTLNFYNGSVNTVSSCIVRNNIFTGSNSIYSNGNTIAPGLLIDHNLIEGGINQITYATITNNIFFYANIAASSDNNYNVYNSNINVYSPVQTLPFGTNSGSNDTSYVNPALVFSNALSNTVGFPAVVNYDWQLNALNVGHNGATDGTDIGIYGGAFPMPNLTGASTLPQINLMNIKNSSIPLNGTLNYEFKARAEN